MFAAIKRFFLGDPINPFHPGARRHLSLIVLLAWVGLGADPLSSSCYGPEQAYLALEGHPHLALYIAAIMVVTIFIISLGYNQVIELFPSGGGGYKVASKLLHPSIGLISGAALIVDYILTIAISIASGADSVFSFLPISWGAYKLYIEAFFIILLLILNLRGMKETIQILLPIVLGFIITHIGLIIYGVISHSNGLPTVVPDTLKQTRSFAQEVGWIGVIGFILHAYSLGGGTYTGLEAVSNNVQRLAEPRVSTGKKTMFYMALSLSFTAGGIMLLYLLWNVKPVAGQTLNAVVFHAILGDSQFGHAMLMLTLLLEGGLLFVAANSGFLAGPNVLANMAIDGWVPNRFRHLSSRLAIQNGLVLFGIAALIILIITAGNVALLVVLYSINVFVTFTLSLVGICVYWIKHRATATWLWHFIFSLIACLITSSILCVTLYYKFMAGGWLTILITSSLVFICLLVKKHYHYVAKKLKDMDQLLKQPLETTSAAPLAINPKSSTAIIFVNGLSMGMHTFLTIQRLFPGQFKNFVFLSVGVVDVESFSAQNEMDVMQTKVNDVLDYFVKYCRQHDLPAEAYAAFGTDTVAELKTLTDKVNARYTNAIFFASQLIFAHDNMVTRFLHSQTSLILQHYLHFLGKELMIIPMKV